MPGGSKYPGPAEALDLFKAAVGESRTDTEVKGAKSPYTSRNGHMFSFLDPDGRLALRLPEELQENFTSRFKSGPVSQHGSVVKGYVSVPDDLLQNPHELSGWLEKSYEWIGTLKPKRTTTQGSPTP
jgi:hypothetical protein